MKIIMIANQSLWVRLVKALALLVLIDALLGIALGAALQLLPAQTLCLHWMSPALSASGVVNCNDTSQGDLLVFLRATLMVVMLASGAAAGAWLLAGYGIADWGTPGGLRKKTPVWWAAAAAGGLGAGLVAYWQPTAAGILSEEGRMTVSFLAVPVAAGVYFFSTVLATPRVLRGQVPGGSWMMRLPG